MKILSTEHPRDYDNIVEEYSTKWSAEIMKVLDFIEASPRRLDFASMEKDERIAFIETLGDALKVKDWRQEKMQPSGIKQQPQVEEEKSSWFSKCLISFAAICQCGSAQTKSRSKIGISKEL